MFSFWQGAAMTLRVQGDLIRRIFPQIVLCLGGNCEDICFVQPLCELPSLQSWKLTGLLKWPLVHFNDCWTEAPSASLSEATLALRYAASRIAIFRVGYPPTGGPHGLRKFE